MQWMNLDKAMLFMFSFVENNFWNRVLLKVSLLDFKLSTKTFHKKISSFYIWTKNGISALWYLTHILRPQFSLFMDGTRHLLLDMSNKKLGVNVFLT